jgi:glycosyltransferase involved in cell wall biosynthesis
MMPCESIRVMAMLEANTVSGSAKAVLEFAREASLSKFDVVKIDVSILTFSRSREGNKLTEAIRRAGIKLDVIFERGPFDRSVIPQLQNLIKMRRPQLIWSNAVKSHFLVRLGGLNRLAKWVAFHHGYTAEDAKVQLYNQLDRWSLRAADRVITVCRPFADQLRSRGVSLDRIYVQHMPIRPFDPVAQEQVAALRKQLAIADDVRVLLSVGRLSLEKGHAGLIRAFHALRQRKPSMPMHLVLVGDGPERSNVLSLTERLKVTADVTLVGQQDDVRPYFAMADMFVLPSHSEGSPNVLLEAMSMGLPVVATFVGGIPELVTDEIDALLVEDGDTTALAGALSRVLENRDLHETLKRAGQRSVSRRTTKAYYCALAEIFRGVCAANGVCDEVRMNSTKT